MNLALYDTSMSLLFFIFSFLHHAELHLIVHFSDSKKKILIGQTFSSISGSFREIMYCMTETKEIQIQ